jgi:hypothetical protein
LVLRSIGTKTVPRFSSNCFAQNSFLRLFSPRRRDGSAVGASVDGFSLVEVIVAFVILTVVAVSFAQALSMTSRTFMRADALRDADFLASRILAERMMSEWPHDESQTGGEGDYSWRIEREAVADTGGSDLHLARLRLRIFDKRRHEVRSLISYEIDHSE